MAKRKTLHIGIALSFAAATIFALLSPLMAKAQNINPLEQWTSTSTPSAAITQRTYNKAIKITGLTTGQCLTLDSNNILTTTSCGGGGSSGLASSTPWSVGNIAYVVSNGAVSSVATTTISATYPLSLSATPVVIGASPITLTSALSTTTSNTWAGTQTFTNLSATNATTSSLYVTNLTSALSLFDANGQATEYAGASCTNQFIRSLSAVGAATCATVANTDLANSTISGISLGSNLADLSATDSTLTFSGTYNGGTARTIGINLANPNTWTALQTINSASTTNLTIGSFLQIPNSTSQSPTLAGAVGYDTTSGQLKVGDGSATRVIGNGYQYPSFSYATSTTWTGTTTRQLGPASVAETWHYAECYTNAGTANVSISDGTNLMTMVPASSTPARYALSTNNTFTAGEKRQVAIGTPASSPTEVTCTITRSITAD